MVISKLQSEVMRQDVLEEIADSILEHQAMNDTALPLLDSQLRSVNKKLTNIMQAIESGIITGTTKQRLEEEKGNIEIRIAQERLSKPILTRELIMNWFEGFRNGDIQSLKCRQLLVDFFVHRIVVYDKLAMLINYQNGTKDVSIPHALCSDMTLSGTPRRGKFRDSKALAKARAFSCSTAAPFPHATRCAGLARGPVFSCIYFVCEAYGMAFYIGGFEPKRFLRARARGEVRYTTWILKHCSGPIRFGTEINISGNFVTTALQTGMAIQKMYTGINRIWDRKRL